ncbi:MAG: hypothetical protein ACRCSI_10240 [Eubacterium aggregans]
MKNAENTVSILKGNILYPMDEHRIGAKPGGYLICQDDAVVGVFDAVPQCIGSIPSPIMGIISLFQG